MNVPIVTMKHQRTIWGGSEILFVYKDASGPRFFASRFPRVLSPGELVNEEKAFRDRRIKEQGVLAQ